MTIAFRWIHCFGSIFLTILLHSQPAKD